MNCKPLKHSNPSKATRQECPERRTSRQHHIWNSMVNKSDSRALIKDVWTLDKDEKVQYRAKLRRVYKKLTPVSGK